MISMFQIRRKLTEGAFSTTFEVIHIETGLIYCLKVFEKLKIKQQGLQ
jgi:serine/threonine protein kinase